MIIGDKPAFSSTNSTRRLSESTKALGIRRCGPYHARHSSVTWQLMLRRNLLWVAKQRGHSVEVMLRMYPAWLEGATEDDIHAIKQAMEKRSAAREAIHDSRVAISSVIAATNRVTHIVIRPPKSPEFGSSLAVDKPATDLSTGEDLEIRWRRGWDYSALRASPLRGRPGGRYPRFVAAVVDCTMQNGIDVTTGGEGGIRTHANADRNQ